VVRKKKQVRKLVWETKEEEQKNKQEEQKKKEEGCSMANKKIQTNLSIQLEENEQYNWIGFELDEKYYIGFEGSSDLQAIIVSKNFFQVFKEEFEESSKGE